MKYAIRCQDIGNVLVQMQHNRSLIGEDAANDEKRTSHRGPS